MRCISGAAASIISRFCFVHFRGEGWGSTVVLHVSISTLAKTTVRDEYLSFHGLRIPNCEDLRCNSENANFI